LLEKIPLASHFARFWERLEKEFCWQRPLKGGKVGDDGT
jgi:hypothetical protein